MAKKAKKAAKKRGATSSPKRRAPLKRISTSPTTARYEDLTATKSESAAVDVTMAGAAHAPITASANQQLDGVISNPEANLSADQHLEDAVTDTVEHFGQGKFGRGAFGAGFQEDTFKIGNADPQASTAPRAMSGAYGDGPYSTGPYLGGPRDQIAGIPGVEARATSRAAMLAARGA